MIHRPVCAADGIEPDRLAADGGLALRLPVTPGYDWAAVRSFLAARAIPGVEVARR